VRTAGDQRTVYHHRLHKQHASRHTAARIYFRNLQQGSTANCTHLLVQQYITVCVCIVYYAVSIAARYPGSQPFSQTRIAGLDNWPQIAIPTIQSHNILLSNAHIGADTGGRMGRSIPTFIPALLVLLFLGGLSPCEQKFFRLAAFAIIIPPTCESESAPLPTQQRWQTEFFYFYSVTLDS
jgi:hypothetical protein